jgi:hypothetical protein
MHRHEKQQHRCKYHSSGTREPIEKRIVQVIYEIPKKISTELCDLHWQTTKTATQRRTKPRKISDCKNKKKNTQNYITKSCHHLTKKYPGTRMKSAVQSKSSMIIFSIESFPQALLLKEKHVVLNHGKAAY